MLKRLAGVITVAILFMPLAAAPSPAWSQQLARHSHRLVDPAGGFSAAGIGAASVPASGSGTIGTLPRVLVGSGPQAVALDTRHPYRIRG